MKRSVQTLAVGASFVFLTCSTAVDLSERPLFDNGVYALQVLMTNGLTGEAVTDATLSVEVGQQSLGAVSSANQYTVYGIPGGDHPIFVTASGFLAFQSLGVSFNLPAAANDNLATGVTYNYIFGNIVLYPVGTVAEDITVRVFDGEDGTPINGATVILNLDAAAPFTSNNDIEAPLPAAQWKRIRPSAGLQPTSLTAQTSAGVATFPGSGLVVGGGYDVDVIGGRNADGELLSMVSKTLIIGTNPTDVDIFMTQPVVATAATKQNNETPEGENGSLVITFATDIALCSADDPNAEKPHTLTLVNNPGAATVPSVADPDASDVTSSVSANVLTLTPNFATAGDTAMALEVSFGGVQLRNANQQDSACVGLGTLTLRGVGGLDLSIHVRKP